MLGEVEAHVVEQPPEHRPLDQQGRGQGLGGVVVLLGGVAEGGAGEEAVVGEVDGDVVEEPGRPPLPEGRLDLLVDQGVEARVGRRRRGRSVARVVQGRARARAGWPQRSSLFRQIASGVLTGVRPKKVASFRASLR